MAVLFTLPLDAAVPELRWIFYHCQHSRPNPQEIRVPHGKGKPKDQKGHPKQLAIQT